MLHAPRVSLQVLHGSWQKSCMYSQKLSLQSYSGCWLHWGLSQNPWRRNDPRVIRVTVLQRLRILLFFFLWQRLSDRFCCCHLSQIVLFHIHPFSKEFPEVVHVSFFVFKVLHLRVADKAWRACWGKKKRMNWINGRSPSYAQSQFVESVKRHKKTEALAWYRTLGMMEVSGPWLWDF